MFPHRRVLGLVAGGVGALAIGVLPSAAAATPGPQVAVTGAAILGAGATALGTVPAGEHLSLQINLGLRDEPGAEAYARAAATPGTALSGRYLSEAGFESRFGPRPADVGNLEVWLRTNRISVDSIVGNQIVTASGSAGSIAKAFSTRISRVRTGTVVTATAVTPLHVPASLGRVVDSVAGLRPALRPVALNTGKRVLATTAVAGVPAATPRRGAVPATLPNDPTCPQYFGQTPARGPRPPFSTSGTSVQECSVFLDPTTGRPVLLPAANYAKMRTVATINARYTGTGRRVGIVLWNRDGSAEASTNYAARLNGTAPIVHGQITAVVDGSAPSGCQPLTDDDRAEVNLDIQAVHLTAPSAAIRYFGSSHCAVPDRSLATAVGEANPVSVLTNSWGFPNQDYTGSSPEMRSIHTSLVKAAVRGISVLFSSGDTGDGTTLSRNFGYGAPRTPGYPATDPYAVAVGGVGSGTKPGGALAFRQAWTPAYYSSNGTSAWAPVDITQLGANAIGTSGGTSRVFAAPAWQKAAGVSTTGRVVPDIANQASLFFLPMVVVLQEGGRYQVTAFGGTSVASPLTAGHVADAVSYQGKTYLGLLTPSLYRQRGTSLLSDVGRQQHAVSTPLDAQGGQLLIGEERPAETLITKPGFDDATGLGAPGTGWLSLLGR